MERDLPTATLCHLAALLQTYEMVMESKVMHPPWRCYEKEAHPSSPASFLAICPFEPVPDLLSAQIFSEIYLPAHVKYSLS